MMRNKKRKKLILYNKITKCFEDQMYLTLYELISLLSDVSTLIGPALQLIKSFHLICFSIDDIAKATEVFFNLNTFCLSFDNHCRYCACSEKAFKAIFVSCFRNGLLFLSYWIGLFSSFERTIQGRTRCQRTRLIKTSRGAFKVLQNVLSIIHTNI